jgi:hypothetical protein
VRASRSGEGRFPALVRVVAAAAASTVVAGVALAAPPASAGPTSGATTEVSALRPAGPPSDGMRRGHTWDAPAADGLTVAAGRGHTWDRPSLDPTP